MFSAVIVLFIGSQEAGVRGGGVGVGVGVGGCFGLPCRHVTPRHVTSLSHHTDLPADTAPVTAPWDMSAPAAPAALAAPG